MPQVMSPAAQGQDTPCGHSGAGREGESVRARTDRLGDGGDSDDPLQHHCPPLRETAPACDGCSAMADSSPRTGRGALSDRRLRQRHVPPAHRAWHRNPDERLPRPHRWSTSWLRQRTRSNWWPATESQEARRHRHRHLSQAPTCGLPSQQRRKTGRCLLTRTLFDQALLGSRTKPDRRAGLSPLFFTSAVTTTGFMPPAPPLATTRIVCRSPPGRTVRGSTVRPARSRTSTTRSTAFSNGNGRTRSISWTFFFVSLATNRVKPPPPPAPAPRAESSSPRISSSLCCTRPTPSFHCLHLRSAQLRTTESRNHLQTTPGEKTDTASEEG